MPDRKNDSGLDVLRWLGVLPCAYLAHWLLQGLGFALFSFLRGPGYPEFLFPLVQYFPSSVALIFVGATVAPRRRLEVAVILAAVSMYLSWKIHVLGQLTPGLANYMHATGDSIGLLVGVTLFLWRVQKSKFQAEARPDAN